MGRLITEGSAGVYADTNWESNRSFPPIQEGPTAVTSSVGGASSLLASSAVEDTPVSIVFPFLISIVYVHKQTVTEFYLPLRCVMCQPMSLRSGVALHSACEPHFFIQLLASAEKPYALDK